MRFFRIFQFLDNNSLKASKRDIQINIDEKDFFEISIEKKDLNLSLNVSVACDSQKCKTIAFEKQTVRFAPNSTTFRFEISAKNAGHDVIVATIADNNTNVDDSDSFVRIRVGRAQALATLAEVVGWIYFVIWSASFWPQNISNFRRKSVIGYNLDFAALNVTGFLFYSIYNSGIYFSLRIQSQYEATFP
ncbi:unnamed protein product, partial [Medioppia subpectinata]